MAYNNNKWKMLFSMKWYMPGYENPAFQRQEEKDGCSDWVLLIHRLCHGAFHGHFSLRTLKAMNTMPYLVKDLWPRCLPGVNAAANDKFILLKTTKITMWFHMVHHTAKKLSSAHVSTSPFLSCEGQGRSRGLAWGSTASEMSSSDTSMTFLPQPASSITDFMVSVYHISHHPLHTAVLQQPTGYHLTGQIHSHVINKGQENVLIVKQKRKLISIVLSNSTK